MAIKLHHKGFAHAQMLIKAHEVEHDEDGTRWHDEDAPTQDEFVRYLNTHTIEEFGLWFLGVNTEIPRENKEHYVFPHGDLSEVHRCAVIEAEKQARSQNLPEIADAAKKLLAMINTSK